MTKFLFTILFLKFSFASQLSLENINDVLINFLLEKIKPIYLSVIFKLLTIIRIQQLSIL